MHGSGTTVVLSGGSLVINGTGPKYLDVGRTLSNAGVVSRSGGILNVGNQGATINNLAGGMFDFLDDTGITFYIGGRTFNNAGSVRKTGGPGASSLGINFNNTGAVEVHSGTLSFGAAVAQVSGSTVTGGTWYVGPNSTLALTGTITTNQGNVTLDGTGSQFAALNNLASNAGSFALLNGRSFTTAGNWNSSGSLTVGAGSTLTVNGTFAQTSSGSLTVQLAGTAAGQFSRVVVSGLATLDGTLNVTLVGGFTPAAGNSFQVMSFGSVSSDIATKTGFSLGGGLFLREDLTGGVTLQAFQAQLLFQQQPTDTTAGQPISPAVTVAIVDPATSTPIAFDNTDTVTVSLNGGGTLAGTLTQTVSGGVETFANLSINQAGTGYTLNANSTSLAQVTSTAFAIRPAAADHLLFLQQPTDTTAGQAITPAVTVEILDQFNNVLTNDNTDTITVARSDGGTLNGTLTQTVSGGVATFGDLSINQAGTGYMLNANSTGLAQITSNGFAITAAAADHLLFSQQPTDTPAGQTISPVVLQVVDQFGNVVTNYSGTVTLSLNDNPMTGATLSGTLTVTVVNGVATFSDLSIDLAGTGYTLHATIGGGLPDIDSNQFNIT